MEDKQLTDLAFKAMANSYSPYSHFKVGACILCDDGSYFLGTNIENASFGATNCAERSAVFAAYSQGYRAANLVALAVVTQADQITTPCGICRQVLCELVSPDMPIILSNGKQTVKTSVSQLFPMDFSAKDLKNDH